uniref:Odorant receptor n=1 Tax=Aulacocentrum confusum TaxID=2767324 RepID=A0A7G8Z947_9HYME|nr:olfactory receptor 28 [Aulacocentrum confusum]
MNEDKENWNNDTFYALGMYRAVTQVLGIWPINCENLFSKMRACVVVMLMIQMAVSFVPDLLVHCNTMTGIIDALTLMVGALLTVIKIVVCYVNREKMFRIVHAAVKDWATVEDDDEKNIMRRYAARGRFVFILQMGSTYINAAGLIFGHIPFAGKSNDSEIITRGYPVGSSCVISSNTSDGVYIFKYVLQSIQLFIQITGNIGGDVCFFVIAMYLCSQFVILNSAFERCKIHTNYGNQKICQLIQRHQYLLSLVDYFEDVYNLVILGQLLANGLFISITVIILLISLRDGDLLGIFESLIRLDLFYIQLFIYSYAGDHLTSNIEKVKFAVYCCEWYSFPLGTAKNLVFVIMRINRHFHLTAGKFYRMNLENFKNIVKLMGSFFSVLRLIFVD